MYYIFCLFVIILLYVERLKYKTIITPVSLMGISYLIAIVVAKIGEIFYSYYTISSKTFSILIISLVFAWLPSVILPIYSSKELAKEKKQFSNTNIFYMYMLLILLFMGLILKLRNGKIATEAFESNYMHGPFAHILNLFTVIIMYSICFAKKKFSTILLIIFGVFFIFLSGVKYHIMFVFLIYILKLLYKGNIKDFWFIGILCLIGVLALFIFNYFASFFLRGVKNDAFMKFVLNHFCMYISGGIIAFSRLLDGFHPGINNFVFIDSLGLKSTNVYTIIGQLYMQFGYKSYFVILFLSFIAYILFYLFISNKERKQMFYFLVYVLFSGVPFLLSFFGSYYDLSRTYELPIIASILFFLLQKNFAREIIEYKI